MNSTLAQHPAAGSTRAFVVFVLLISSSVSASLAFAQSAIPRETLRSIAIAEDQRRWDGTLRGHLADPSPAVRARAALAVGRLQDSTTVDALRPLLDDADPAVRREAVFALGQIGHRSARDAVEAKLGDPDAETVDLALEALGKIGDEASTPKVLDMLGHERAQLRATAAVALWRLADSTALERLVSRHDDPDPQVRWRVIYALERINAPDRIGLVAALHQDDDDWLVRAYAARTLGRQRSARGTSYLLQMLGDDVPAVVVNALRSIQTVADSTCGFCAQAVTQALGHENPYVRVTAATALSNRAVTAAATEDDRDAAVAALRKALADRDPATRAAAAAALLAQVGAEAWDDVTPLLEDPFVYVRGTVMQAMANVDDARVEPLLLERTGWRFQLHERMSAALALGTRKTRSAAPVLRAELYSRDPLVVAACASALEQIGDTLAVPSLVNRFEAHASASDPDARIALRDALRALAGRAFADSLERAHPEARNTPDTYPEDFGAPPSVKGAVLTTTKGEIEWSFYRAEAPQTVANFARLAREGYFDGLTVHRVVPNFVIQDGDPTGIGWGGPGYAIRCEYNRLQYASGMVGMALSGKDTGGSQWFITHSPQMHLNGRYTIFARVTRGMEVVHRIVQGDRVTKVRLIE